MHAIQIIRDKSKLQSTAYIELLPGRYRDECWNEGSLFFEEEVFGYMELIITRHVPSYDHFAFTEISSASWAMIIHDFDSLALALDRGTSLEALSAEIAFFFRDSKLQFAENLQANSLALSGLLRDISVWITIKAKEQGCVTVLGM